MSGLHLPAYAAADGGLFAEYGLDVEFVDCVSPSGGSLGAWSAMVTAVADGTVDFALTSVAYLLAGQSVIEGPPGARFAAVFHQRNPIAALVADDSDVREARDLAGRRLAQTGNWFLREFEDALTRLGLGPMRSADPRGDPWTALEHEEIDAIAGWADMTAGYSKQGLNVRAIPLGIDGYATGLVAADRLTLELVTRMRDALAGGYELQREHPELGIAALRRRLPNIPEERLRAGWSAFEPYAFGQSPPLSMDAERWHATIEHTAAAHGLPSPRVEHVYRPELVAGAMGYVPA